MFWKLPQLLKRGMLLKKIEVEIVPHIRTDARFPPDQSSINEIPQPDASDVWVCLSA